MWLEGAFMETVSAYLSTASTGELDHPKIKSGVATMRAGSVETINALLTALPLDGLGDAWRRDRVVVLAAVAPKAAKFLLQEDLVKLSQKTTEIAGQMTDPGLKAALTSVAEALTRR